MKKKVAEFQGSVYKRFDMYIYFKISTKNLYDAFGNINQFDAHKIDLFGEEESKEGNQH